VPVWPFVYFNPVAFLHVSQDFVATKLDRVRWEKVPTRVNDVNTEG